LTDTPGKCFAAARFRARVDLAAPLCEHRAMLPLALVIGIVAGLRTMTAPAALAWGAVSGAVAVDGSPVVFLSWRFAPWVLTVLAGMELIGDQLPMAPSRKLPLPFAARMVSGALCGAAVGIDQGALLPGLALGLAGAVIGTLGGYRARRRLAVAVGNDRIAALIEDAVAIVLAIVVVVSL
jgi:uncharacterized membrane protein